MNKEKLLKFLKVNGYDNEDLDVTIPVWILVKMTENDEFDNE